MLVCARCSFPSSPEDPFCSRCGLPLQQAGALVEAMPQAPPQPAPAAALNRPQLGVPLEGPYAVSDNRPPGSWCPNCSLHLPVFKQTCPNCKATMVMASAGQEFIGDAADLRSSDYFTFSATADFWLGICLAVAAVCAGGIGIVAIPIAVFALRNRYGQLCRGMLIGGIVTLFIAFCAWYFFGVGAKNKHKPEPVDTTPHREYRHPSPNIPGSTDTPGSDDDTQGGVAGPAGDTSGGAQ